MKRRALNVVVSLLAVALALYLLDWQALKESIARVDPWFFVLVVLLLLAHFFIMGIRWVFLVRRAAGLSAAEHLRRYFCATFINTFTPANIGGDAYRALTLREHAGGLGPIVQLLIRERFLGLLAYFLGYLLCLGASLAAFPGSEVRKGGVFPAAGVLIALGAAALFVVPWLVRLAASRGRALLGRRMADAAEALYRASRFGSLGRFAGLMGLSLAALCVWIASVSLVAGTLGIHVPWVNLALIVILVELCRLVPVSLQGIGIREGTFAFFMGLVGESAEGGFILGTVAYLALSVAILAAGLIGYAPACLSRTR